MPSGIPLPTLKEEIKTLRGYEISKLQAWMTIKQPGKFLDDLESHLALLWDNILGLTHGSLLNNHFWKMMLKVFDGEYGR